MPPPSGNGELSTEIVSGVYACSIGFQPFGDLLLAEADRLTA